MLLKKGAEASLYIEEWYGREVVIKKRLPKAYRIAELDRQIREYRTKHEPMIMHRAKEAGVPTPIIFLVEPEEATIVMEHVEGEQVKNVLDRLPREQRINICVRIGELIGKLHRAGIVHGDLTTSNLILTPQGRIVFVDFGLSEQTSELEPRGVDLHLMKRAFASTHYRYADECFKAVISGYMKVMGEEETEKVMRKIMEIEKRGRYVAER
ncbi:MAG: Kae1-associated kinase Bud32 [Nitrososphaerota archaeon]|nr:Kae1-associated kinase Bud32 [Nitrososphaerota archaeon]